MSYSILEAAQTEYFTLKLGEQGWRVLVCQIALNSHYPSPGLVLDGDAGPKTIAALKALQKALGITQDGVAGPETQEHFTKAKCKHAEKGMTPPGLLAGSCNIESSYQWACVSPVNSNNTVDYGVTQDSISQPPSEAKLQIAFDPESACRNLAAETRGAYNSFAGKVPPQRAWQLAALNHNWPSAAWAIATGNDAWLSQPEDWLTAKGFASGRAYVDHYVAVATAQVTSWTVV